MRNREKYKHWFFVSGIVILVIGWLVIAGTSLSCAFYLNCNADAADWWRHFLTVVGIPVVIYQLYNLNQTIQKGQWKPIIDIGIVATRIDFSKLDEFDKLPKQAEFDLDYFSNLGIDKLGEMVQLRSKSLSSPFTLIVRNSGKRVARFVKIRLNLVTHPGKEIPILHSESFEKLSDETTMIFRGDSEWAIYPYDSESFPFSVYNRAIFLQNQPSISYEFSNILNNADDNEKQVLLALTFGQLFDVGTYIFNCTIWAEGVDKLIEEKITVKIIDTKAYERSEILAKIITRQKELETTSPYTPHTESSDLG